MNAPRIAIVIPARYGSTRLPGKPLADICGKPMIVRVLERAQRARGIDRVIVATDDARIAAVSAAAGADVVMTGSGHASGTERIIEAMASLDADILLNLQGDEPLADPDHLTLLARTMADDPGILVATLCCPASREEAASPHAVKVVVSDAGFALYFSRSVIPYAMDAAESAVYLRHIGMYAYTRQALLRFRDLPMGMLEQAERLEQLRFLAAGIPIRVLCVPGAFPGVDTPDCLERARAALRTMAGS
jgi:3-deoxy-manno-octulosonate cytidylyltransferase (CMP-KDO synthetase)